MTAPVKAPTASRRRLLPLLFALTFATLARATDKNGVAPQAISLPSGPGSIQGLGESFQPQLNSGSGSYQVPLMLPRGTGGLTPSLALVYNSGGGNGPLGIGWSLSGSLSIRRNTDHGVPRYVDGPNDADDDFDGRIDNPEELDTFTGLSGEELVPLADGSFRAENEGGFVRYTRSGAGWEARTPDGARLTFGLDASARIEDSGRVLAWCLERHEDRHGNAIDYEYLPDPATPAQKYPRRIRWGQPDAYFAVVLTYAEGRPDVTVSYQPRYELRTSLRLVGLDVFSQGIPAPAFAERADLDGDGKLDALIRRYRLDYDAESHLSLLSRVTLLGADGTTAMPALSFGYSRWTPPDNVSATLIRSLGAPAEGFDGASTELIDMNGDGLPDLLSTSGSQHRVAINLGVDAGGRLVWAPSRPVGNAPTIDIASERIHLADETADGLSDLMVKASNTNLFCYGNTSKNAWSSAPFPMRNTDTWPIWPFDGDSGKLSRSFDADYSRSNDILHTTDTGMQLWLLLPDARYGREVRLPPPTCEGQIFRFDLPGAHIADLNGDRLQDLAWIQASRVVYFPSRGRGEFAEPIILSLSSTLSAAEIERAGFSDVDGDGLVDVTLVRPSFEPNGIVYWLNRFDRGLEAPRTVRGLPALRAGDALRWADMNGNGTTDVVISQAQSAPGEKILVVDLVPEGKIHLLTSVENGMGLRISLAYESSTAQMVRAETAGTPWESVMPIATTVVASISEDDGRGQVYQQRITYRDPHYDAAKQEFRGFRSAEAYEPGDASIGGKRSQQVFDRGIDSACLKGKLLGEDIVGEDGTLFQRSVRTWQERVLAVGIDGRQVCFAFESARDQLIHEGQSSAIQLHQESDYDDYGNVVSERNHGIVDRSGDELFVDRTFEPRLDLWLLRLVGTATRTDGDGKLLDDQRFFYDAAGDLVRSESWLDTEDRWIPVVRQSFDAFGNVVESQDARGTRRSVAFDALLHAFPATEVLHLEGQDLTMTAGYDLGFGVVTGAVDFHGRQTSYVYDALGRIVEQERPGGAGDLYEYEYGNPVSRVTKRLRLDGQGATFDSHSYSDAYGRVLGTKIASEGGRWRFVDVKSYNARKVEAITWLPYATGTPGFEAPDPAQPHEEHIYDATGRPVESRKADGSILRQEYRPLEVAVFDGNDTGPDGEPVAHRRPNIRRTDGLGRLTSVEERNGDESYLTRYGWTALGQLETIVDALDNTRRFRFDSLGRLVESSDPDRGLRRYAYDDVGNLVRREDAKGQVTVYEFDAANRVLSRDYQGLLQDGADVVDSAYHYDAPAGLLDFGDGSQGSARNVVGRLAWVEDASGDEHFSYDERGNIEWVLKRLRDRETGVLIPYRTQQGYDLLNREVETIFPDNDRCRYLRGAGGFVERIDGGPLGKVILGGAEYAPSGQPLRLELGNGVVSSFEYDASQRLSRLRTEDPAGKALLDESIEYDGASNVVAIADQRPLEEVPADSARRRSASFQYDELNRLIEVGYGAGLGRIDYVHDPLGNLLEQTTPAPGAPGHISDGSVSLGALSYQGGRSGRDGRLPASLPGPHAVTGTASGRRFTYDLSGNLSAMDAAALAWDFEDRLVAFARPGVSAEYVRDHSHRRVMKLVFRGSARTETHSVSMDFEVQEGSPLKYIDMDGRRVARVDGVLDPSRERVQRLVIAAGWNLVASAVESTALLRDVLGADAAVYEASGDSYAAVDSSSLFPSGKAIWVHAPTARLAVLRGNVPPAADGGTAPPLQAWTRLESFRPADHAGAADRLWLYDAKSRRWLHRDPSLPAFLNDAPAELGAATAFWSPDRVSLRPTAAAARSVVHFHADHLGSPAALTDDAGQLLEERAHYPYGAVRSLFRPDAAGAGGESADARWEFTGKQRDRESGIVDMGARGYLDLAGVFLSPDPRYADAASLGSGGAADQSAFTAFLADPQMGNLYAYATRNPLKFVDPGGLDVTFSKELQKSPVFQEALALFKSTKEGQRLLSHLEQSKAKVTLSEGRVYGTDRRTGKYGEVYGTTTTEFNSKININIALHQKLKTDKDALIFELADTIHHELRHAEGNANVQELAIARRNLDALGEAAAIMKIPRHKDDPRLRMGEEVHKGLDLNGDDPYNAKFQEEAKAAQFEQIKARVRQQHPLIETDL